MLSVLAGGTCSILLARITCVFALSPIVTEVSRRSILLQGGSAALVSASALSGSVKTQSSIPSNLQVLNDPNTYASLVYQPKKGKNDDSNELYPMIVFLHGAGKNEGDISNLADIQGEYGGLLPSLLANESKAPQVVLDNFIVVAPYVGKGKRSFYDEPRSSVLNCISHAAKTIPNVDPSRIHLFGFSDGATLAVELLTTQRFASGIICSYGYTGLLPDLALQKLAGVIPLWVFHSADDAIFRVQNSDQLVSSLRKSANAKNSSSNKDLMIRYTRYDEDPERFQGPAQGHTTGITASRDSQVYEWLLSLPPRKTAAAS